jgi:molybdate-binding protein/transcriptional regulator with XRE-family HTH domain
MLADDRIMPYDDMIVSIHRQLHNRLKTHRLQRGWSQAKLAGRSGISRAAVSAIEIQRLVPSVGAALSLASALGVTVEELFGPGSAANEPAWAWTPERTPCRYWQAMVNGRELHFPVEAVAAFVPHDGVYREGKFERSGQTASETTLVMASCDPAASLLAAELARTSGIRLLVLPRSSRKALELLRQGLVHVAGVHLSTSEEPEANAHAVKESLGGQGRLLRVAAWQEGLAIEQSAGIRSVRSALRADLRWVGRETGSAARQCLDELLAKRSPPQRLARDHRGVAEAVRCGWADIGVCHRLVTEEAQLRFLPVREENYDLCFAASAESDPRIQSLVRAVRSTSYRKLLGELPGIDTTAAGDLQVVH